jgi:hypothetical protein
LRIDFILFIASIPDDERRAGFMVGHSPDHVEAVAFFLGEPPQLRSRP